MPRIEWNDEFSVGVAEIDAQHQRWIALINTLHDVLMGEANPENFSVKHCLDEMVAYADFHLDFEEKMLAEAGYPLFEQHRAEHEKFRARLQELVRADEQGRTLLNTEVMNMLTGWLREHILKSDMAYKAHLMHHGRGQETSP